MEMYMSRNVDDMIVPRSQGQSEQSLLLDNSFQWDVGFNMCKELPCPVTDYGMWDSDNRLVGDWVDYQLDNLGGMDQMNGNFMTSFLEEDPPPMSSSYQSYEILPEPKCSKIPFNSLPTNQNDDEDQSYSNDLKYVEVPSPMNWEKLEESQTCMPYDSGNYITRTGTSSETNTPLMEVGQVFEETSVEETTLHELEMAMTQLTDETRISFRDALYRLATSSRQRQLEDEMQSKEPTVGGTSRFGKAQHTETETNFFDSGVAHLLFNELNSNNPDLYHASSQKNQLQQSCRARHLQY